MSEKEKFFAYCRESIDLESGIKIQKEKIAKYADFKNIEISMYFIDNDSSAYKYRPQYEKMKETLLKDANIRGIICTNLTRFGRDTVGVLTEYNEISAAKKEIIFIDQNIDTTTSSGRAFLGFLAVMANFERETIRERLLSGLKFASANGTKSGLPMHRPEKLINWKTYDGFAAKGLSPASIAKLMGVSKSKIYNAIKARVL